MSDCDPNTMTVEAGDCVLGGDEVVAVTMAELDTTCRLHRREVHEHVVPM